VEHSGSFIYSGRAAPGGLRRNRACGSGTRRSGASPGANGQPWAWWNAPHRRVRHHEL